MIHFHIVHTSYLSPVSDLIDLFASRFWFHIILRNKRIPHSNLSNVNKRKENFGLIFRTYFKMNKIQKSKLSPPIHCKMNEKTHPERSFLARQKWLERNIYQCKKGVKHNQVSNNVKALGFVWRWKKNIYLLCIWWFISMFSIGISALNT